MTLAVPASLKKAMIAAMIPAVMPVKASKLNDCA